MSNCQRCGKGCEWVSMSFLNLQMCCDGCLKEETKHPKYKETKEEERRQVESGNYNYNPNILVEVSDE